MPKLPFSLFDFKHIDYFEPIFVHIEAAAGVAVPVTEIYKVPEHKITLLLGVSAYVIKTTATAYELNIHRIQKLEPTVTFNQALIVENVGTEEIAWPSGKTTSEHVPGWHLCFMFPGDRLTIAHALTALETIDHKIIIYRIEYRDPRYEK